MMCRTLIKRPHPWHMLGQNIPSTLLQCIHGPQSPFPPAGAHPKALTVVVSIVGWVQFEVLLAFCFSCKVCSLVTLHEQQMAC